MALFIARLPPDCHPRELEDVFLKYGRIIRCDVKRGGYGFIEYEDPRDAEDAIRYCHGMRFLGGRIAVEWARGGTAPGRRERTPRDECFRCGRLGHWARDCPMNSRYPLPSSRRSRNDYYDSRSSRDRHYDRHRDYPDRRDRSKSPGSRSPARSASRSPHRRSRSPPHRSRSPPHRSRSVSRSRSPARSYSRSPPRSPSPAHSKSRSPSPPPGSPQHHPAPSQPSEKQNME